MSSLKPKKVVEDEGEKGNIRESVYNELDETGKHNVRGKVLQRDDVEKKLDYAEQEIDQELKRQNKIKNSGRKTHNSTEESDGTLEITGSINIKDNYGKITPCGVVVQNNLPPGWDAVGLDLRHWPEIVKQHKEWEEKNESKDIHGQE